MIETKFEGNDSYLTEKIIKEYNALTELISQISFQDRQLKAIDGTGGKVSVSDIIAYQIGWGKLLISWYEAGLNNHKFVMPGEGFTKWDYVGLAKHFYEKYHYDGFMEQDKEFKKAVERIILIVEKESISENLDKLGVWDWCTLPSGKQWALSKWITVNTVAPYKRALMMIRKLAFKD